MLLSNVAGRPQIMATRSDYIRDWLSGVDIDNITLADSGATVGAKEMLSVAVIHRAVNVLAHSIASIPVGVYERDGSGRSLAPDQRAHALIHGSPNPWMTSFRFRHLAISRATLYGNFFGELIPGRGGIGSINPLEPETTRVADQLPNGKLLYVTKDFTSRGYGPERKINQDFVLHLRGLSIDGKSGIPLAHVARNAIGLALTAEKHGSMFLRQGSRMSGILTTDGQLDEKDRKGSEASWQRNYGGAAAAGMVPMLSGGLKWQAIQASMKDSQWLEARGFQIEEALRFLGVPGVLCGWADKTATYASAEQFFLSFVIYTIEPLAENFAQELDFSVVINPDKYFVRFNVDPLKAGDIRTRYQAHLQSIQAGWKNRNEVREQEGMIPGPPELDDFLEMTNLAPAGSPGAGEMPATPVVAPSTPPEPQDPADEASARRRRLEAIASRAIERVERHEKAAVLGNGAGQLGAARRYSKDPAAWRAWVDKFYRQDHPGFMVANLAITDEAASRYCETRRQALLEHGVGILEGPTGLEEV